jgi:hypothetical protein
MMAGCQKGLNSALSCPSCILNRHYDEQCQGPRLVYQPWKRPEMDDQLSSSDLDFRETMLGMVHLILEEDEQEGSHPGKRGRS